MVGIDTNILLYAHDRTSHLFNPAKDFIASACEEGMIGLADLSLLEFYSVITDGRKIPWPLSQIMQFEGFLWTINSCFFRITY